jgi:hypothetical protein
VEEVAGGGESSLGRAVLAVLERLEKRVGLLEERVAEVALATTAESSATGPSTSLGTMLEDVLVKLYQVTLPLRSLVVCRVACLMCGVGLAD